MAAIPQPYRTPRGLDDDLRSLLMREGTADLGTVNPDGSPQMTVVQFSLGDEDRMYIPTNGATRKVRNVLERPQATALVDLGFGWVSCTGQARVVQGEEAADLNRAVYERLLTEAGLATIGRFLEAHEESTIEITPTKWLSWQSDVMVGWFEDHGIDPGDPGEWMRDLSGGG
ncbi:MAG: pyridoxamine 5'-phosphate oxidase family protein [Actinomycetota bacterium]